MANYDIGISGLDAAQKALEIIGNNIANAATEGYHRQRIELSPAYSSQSGPVSLGGGVNVAGITRFRRNLPRFAASKTHLESFQPVLV